MVSVYDTCHYYPPSKTCCMTTKALPKPTEQQVKAAVLKSETVHLRVTKNEKEEIKRTAGALHLSITEYLLKCHGLIADQLAKIDGRQ